MIIKIKGAIPDGKKCVDLVGLVAKRLEKTELGATDEILDTLDNLVYLSGTTGEASDSLQRHINRLVSAKSVLDSFDPKTTIDWAEEEEEG